MGLVIHGLIKHTSTALAEVFKSSQVYGLHICMQNPQLCREADRSVTQVHVQTSLSQNLYQGHIELLT